MLDALLVILALLAAILCAVLRDSARRSLWRYDHPYIDIDGHSVDTREMPWKRPRLRDRLQWRFRGVRLYFRKLFRLSSGPR